MNEDYLTEDDLWDRGVNPALVAVFCRGAVELSGHNCERCWALSDLAALFEDTNLFDEEGVAT